MRAVAGSRCQRSSDIPQRSSRSPPGEISRFGLRGESGADEPGLPFLPEQEGGGDLRADRRTRCRCAHAASVGGASAPSRSTASASSCDQNASTRASGWQSVPAEQRGFQRQHWLHRCERTRAHATPRAKADGRDHRLSAAIAAPATASSKARSAVSAATDTAGAVMSVGGAHVSGAVIQAGRCVLVRSASCTTSARSSATRCAPQTGDEWPRSGCHR